MWKEYDMKDKHDKGFSAKRIAENAAASDVVKRAEQASNPAIGSSRDRLGTPGRNGGML